jgi:hypothetical protein
MSLAAIEAFLQSARQAMLLRDQFPPEADPLALESALVSQGLVLLVARLEQCLRQAFTLRCRKGSDLSVSTLAVSLGLEKMRRLKVEPLVQTLSRFGGAHKDTFKDDIATIETATSWDSVINTRNDFAHEGRIPGITLRDLDEYFQACRRVLGSFCRALDLSNDEIKSICPLIL